MHDERKTTIYAIQHCPTGRIYVGRTKDFDSRVKSHFIALKSGSHPNELMQRDYNDYGNDYDLFVLEVVESIYPDMRESELKWMDKLNTGDPQVGYNYKDNHFRKSTVEIPDVSPGVPTPNKTK